MTFAGRLRNDERGAVAVIVALALFAIISMMVLTVDVGSLLYKRRIMVNGADAAALAAAQTCARTTDLSDPEQVADTYATDNVVGLNSTDGGIIASAGCRTGTGYVTVRYTVSQQLAFAQVLGLQNPTPVATAATAGWGALGAANAVPIMLEAGHLQGTCRIPDGATVGDKCAFWYNNNDLGNADWGYLNLDLWNVASTASCSNAGSNDRGGWIVNGYGQLLDLNGSPPGSSPTYVCVDTGHTSADWQTLHGEEGKIKAFPVNDCGGQVNRDGVLAPCPTTPDKYDIIGFSLLLVRHVYKGNDALGIGTAGQTGSCTNKSLPAGLLLNQTVDLGAFAVSNCAAPATPDSIPFDSNFNVNLKVGSVTTTYVGCKVGTGLPPCSGVYDYTYNEQTKILTWHHAPSTNEKISFTWSTNGTAGACGFRDSDPNAICLVTEWEGFTTSAGSISGGQNFGAEAIRLCDLMIAGSCPGH